MALGDAERDDLLDRLGEEFAARLRRGEQPSLKDYADRYPELADEIRELFPAMLKVEQVKEICYDRDEAETRTLPLSQVGDYRIIREIGHGGMGVVYEAEQISLGRRVALKVLPWQVAKDRTTLERFRREARASARLHHTNIVPVFEVGKDGEVCYYAMQFIQGQSLDSVIDELRRLRGRSPAVRGNQPAPAGERGAHGAGSGMCGDAERVRLVQTLLSGRFDPGPGVVADGPSAGVPEASPPGSVGPEPVHPTVPDSSAVMPGGAQLSSVESRHRAFHRAVAHIGRQAASALAHAHARGIVHRDVKPSNLLLDTEGVVWVSDFGLAKVDDDELTRTGEILGTLRYMAPERLRGRGDARADLYSLGLTLYELLVLRPAFDAHDRHALSEQIKTLEPPRPRSIDPRIPRDLETIVQKAIEKDPRARYAKVEALAEDLRRFLDDEPILARRVRAAERYLRWARRNPVIAALGGVLTAALVGATIASVLVAERMAMLAQVNERAARSERDASAITRAALTQAEAERHEAERHRERAEQNLYISRIGQAEGALRLFDSSTARGLLDQCRPEPGGTDRRGWEWSYLDQWCSPELTTLALPTTADTHCVAVSPDGRLLAVGCAAPFTMGTTENPPVPAYVVSLPDGRVRHELLGHTRFVNAVTFRPDGGRLAALGDEGMIRVWDIDSGRQRRAMTVSAPFYPASGWALGLGWSPDGRRLACTTGNGPIRIWDPETGRETAQIAQPARSVAWSPDGTRIASGGASEIAVRPWDARDDRAREPVIERPCSVDSLTWSRDGRRLAVVGANDDVRSPGWGLTIRDPTSGEWVVRKEHVAELWSVAFSPDGTRLATGGTEGIIRVFDAADGRDRAALHAGCMNVSDLAFSPDGRRLYACGWGMGGVKVFDPARDPRGRGVQPWMPQLAALAFDRDGLRIVGIEWEGGTLQSADPVDGTVETDRYFPVTNARVFPRGDFAFSPDGRRLAAPLRQDRKVVGVWDVALGNRVATLRGSAMPVTAVAFHPDGRSLATAAVGGPDGRTVLVLWHLPSGRAFHTFESGPGPVRALAYSRDGRKLAAGGGTEPNAPGWVTAWDTETGGVLGTLDRVGLVMFLAFHPDGALLALADHGGSKVHLWNLSAGSLITHPGPKQVSCVGFTPDGKRLAALGYDGNVQLCDSQTGDEVLVLRGSGPPPGSGGFTPRMAFSPDGSCIAAHYGIASLLNLWDLGPRSGLTAKPKAGDLAGWLRRGRALAAQGDIASAEAAFSYTRAIQDGDPSPWIEHALTVWHVGNSPEAREAWARAMDALPDDPGRWIGLLRLFEHLGRPEESETARAKARSLLDRQLSRAPHDEATAAALAELLPDAGPSREWTTLQPDVMSSAEGATLTRLPDDSVLAGGLNPLADTYTVEAVTPLAGVTGLRLEAIPDPSLPHHGSGRDAISGNFHLDTVRLSAAIEPGGVAPVSVRLCRACADFSDRRPGFTGVSGTLDADPSTFWSIWPLTGRRHWAIFQTDPPIGTAAGARLRVDLAFRSPSPHSALGRFRLSVTNRPRPLFPTTLIQLRADGERNGLTRLGAAYVLLGDWASAASVLERSAARPDTRALDLFLLALTRHHLGRSDEARTDCDRALERLRIDAADHETHNVALEALANIQGLSIGQAESLLLDAAFPADPLAH
jgi:WD40 repeat protein/tetratricopeptide (TPR) repeat protein